MLQLNNFVLALFVNHTDKICSRAPEVNNKRPIKLY